MPKVTRAVHSSSQHCTPTSKPALPPPMDVAATGAAHRSSHNSDTDSQESGRQRRRRGKLKMQQRISDLEAQNRCLTQLVGELVRRSHSTACGSQPPVLFDVFDLTDDTASVGCQTVISVPHQQPDVFCFLDKSGTLIPLRAGADAAAGDYHHDGNVDASLSSVMSAIGCQSQIKSISRDSQDLPHNLEQTQQDAAFYHAWSGKGMATSGCLHATSPRLRISITDSTNAPMAGPAAEEDLVQPQVDVHHDLALLDPDAKHPVDRQAVFNSQDLARTAVPFATRAHEQCAELELEKDQVHLHDARCVTQTRQEHDVANSMHRVDCRPFVCQPDFKHSPHEHEVDNAMHHVTTPPDFNSHDLANTAVPFASRAHMQCAAQALEDLYGQKEQQHGAREPHATRLEHEDADAMHRVPGTSDSTRQEHEVANAMHRVDCPHDFNSQDLACAAKTCAFENKVQHGELAHPTTRQEHEVANAMHRVDSQPDSQDLAHTSVPFATRAHEHCAGQALEDARFDKNTRQEHDVATAVHHVTTPRDSQSHDLAKAIAQLAAQALENLHGHKEQQHGAREPKQTRQEHDDANAMHRVPGPPDLTRQEHDAANAMHRVDCQPDFNSQDLACAAMTCAFDNQVQQDVLEHPITRQEHEVANAMHRVENQPDFKHSWHEHDESQEHDDDMHRVATPPDFNTQDLAFAAVPFASGANAQCDKQTLEDHQGGKEQQHGAHVARQEHDDARHRSEAHGDNASLALQDQRGTLFFGPSERECQRTLDAEQSSKDFKPLEASASQASAAALCEPLPADFLETFGSILDIFVQRRQPSRNTTRASARGIIFAALNTGVAFESYSDTLYARSPMLWHEVSLLRDKQSQS